MDHLSIKLAVGTINLPRSQATVLLPAGALDALLQEVHRLSELVQEHKVRLNKHEHEIEQETLMASLLSLNLFRASSVVS